MQRPWLSFAIAFVLVSFAGLASAQGAQDPRAGIEIDDQTHVVGPDGNVDQVTMAAAGASVDFYVQLTRDDGTELDRTGVVEANNTIQDVPLNLSPPLREDARVVGTVHQASNGTELARAEATIVVERRRGGLEIPDQEQGGDGGGQVHQVRLGAAGANVPYTLNLTHEDGTLLAQSGPFSADQVREDRIVRLSVPLEGTAQVHGVLRAADSGQTLASDNATVWIQPASGELTVDDQTLSPDEEGQAREITVRRAQANVAYYVDAHADWADHDLVNSPRFAAGSVQEDLTLSLHPPVTDDTTLTVELHTPEGVVLDRVNVSVTLDAPEPDAAETARSAPGPGASAAAVLAAGAALLQALVRRSR